MKILRYLIVVAIILAISLSAYGLEIGVPIYRTLEEFNRFQATADDLPQPFVGYAILQDFGEFDRYEHHFVLGKTGRFFLTDANGHEIFIDVNYPDRNIESTTKYHSMDKSMTDMRTLPSGKSGIVRHNKINYRYVSGILSSISWKIADIGITLTMDRDAGAYPLDAESTPIARLLSTDQDTAYSVVEEIANSIDPDGSYRAAYTTKKCIKIIAPILIIPAPIVVTLFLLHCRSRKKKVMS